MQQNIGKKKLNMIEQQTLLKKINKYKPISKLMKSFWADLQSPKS
jgi:hypothetical protein